MPKGDRPARGSRRAASASAPARETPFREHDSRGRAIHGVFYHVARYLQRERCTQIHGEKHCTVEADNKIIPAESGRHGGMFYTNSRTNHQ